MPKILYIITQAEFGGAQRYVYDLAVNLTEDFEIAAAIGEVAGSDELAKRLADKNIRVIRLKNLVREISVWRDLRAVFEIKKLIKKEKPDIIHLNSSKAGFVGALAVWLSRLPPAATDGSAEKPGNKPRLIYTVHGWIFNEALSSARKKLYLALEKISGRICNALIVLSASEMQAGRDNKIAAAEKMHLIPHGIMPPDFFAKDDAIKALLKKSPLAPFSEGGELIIGTIANFYPTKGLPYLIEAAAKLKNRHNFQLVIVGDGIERGYLESLIVKYNLAENVILAGQIPDAAKYLKAFDIFVLPSIKEGLPYAIIEAMYAGIPIIATAVGGIPEMIENDRDGKLTPPKNPDALAEAIEKLIDAPELRETLGKNARLSAEKKFGLAEMIAKTKKVYE